MDTQPGSASGAGSRPGLQKPAATRPETKDQCGARRRYVARSLGLADRLAWFTKRPDGDGQDECWLWTGTRDGDGYGRIHWRGRDQQAHRMALQLRLGRDLRADEVTRHRATCSKLCVRPTHLQPGTIGDNNRDNIEAGRHAFGERSGTAKLTEEQARLIREGGEEQNFEATGRVYGISGRHVANIVRGRTWKHLPLSARLTTEARS